MSRPVPKGWCPGAYRPMMSGDGLVVRVRPVLARLTAVQALELCDLALEFGSGVIDLTSRANLQIRGVSEANHEPLLQSLNRIGLLPDDPEVESRRNILVPWDWQPSDDTHVITLALMSRLSEFPLMPAKVGFAIDAGVAPVLGANSADFRIERSESGLILRADGVGKGRPLTCDKAVDALLELAHWFVKNGGFEQKRMRHLIRKRDLPPNWQNTASRPARDMPAPGEQAFGALYGAGFGQLNATELQHLIKTSGCSALRVTPWRLFQTENAGPVETDAFIRTASDPLLNVNACPGTPYCASSDVDTRGLARSLAAQTKKPLHISGCAKGCARPRATALTLVGRNGRFDLVKNGRPWDQPSETGLSPQDLTARIGDL